MYLKDRKKYLVEDNDKKNQVPDNKNNGGDDQDPYNFFKFSNDSDDDRNDNNKKGPKFPFFGLMIAIVAVLAFVNIFILKKPEELIDFSTFQQLLESEKIERVEINLNTNLYIGYGKEVVTSVSENQESQSGEQTMEIFPWMKQKNSRTVEKPVYKTTGVLLDSFLKILEKKNIQYRFVRESSNILVQILINILPFLILLVIYFFLMRRMTGGMGGMGSVFGSGNSRSKAVDEGKVKTRFADVAGVDEAKEELVEVVDFLKEPKKYTDIGGKIPKGVLLVGPPGTGKTLLARAVAGEAGVPFFRISGSDFVEMFVGVGASRVRDLFKQAREKAPCIIFIDELDAIGKSRVNNLGGNDEREQTLNQLLVEMDGFDNEKGLIILAATNRPDILDPALLRPGRFDRQVAVERPDVKGREAIIRIHAKNVKLDNGVDFDSLAHGTSGFSGADLANVVNEAALLAVRNGHKTVSMKDFDEAIDKVSIGLKKKTRRENEKKRMVIAYHETGHALVSALTPDHIPVHKITIIPRTNGIGGFTQYREEEEQYLKTKKEILMEIDSLLGGRAAEQIIYGEDEITTGASNDISRATDIVKSMITDYGMSERFRNMTLGKSGRGYGGEPELVREFSEDTQKYIDEEIARIIDEHYNHTLELLSQNKPLLEVIAKRLLELETMDGKEFYSIVDNAKHCQELEAEALDSQKAEAIIQKESAEAAPEENSPEESK